MNFWLLDVKSVVCVNGVDIAFDYINTYCNVDTAINEAKQLFKDENVLQVTVHKWILKEDGTEDHSEDNDCIPYRRVKNKR